MNVDGFAISLGSCVDIEQSTFHVVPTSSRSLEHRQTSRPSSSEQPLLPLPYPSHLDPRGVSNTGNFFPHHKRQFFLPYLYRYVHRLLSKKTCPETESTEGLDDHSSYYSFTLISIHFPKCIGKMLCFSVKRGIMHSHRDLNLVSSSTGPRCTTRRNFGEGVTLIVV